MKHFRYQRIIVLVILFISFSYYISAQKVENIEPKMEENNIIVKYTITNATFCQKFDIDLYISHDGGQTFEGPLENVSGDVGKGIKEGEHRIVWNEFKDISNLNGDTNIVFDVKAQLIEEELNKEFMVSYMGSLDAPMGLTIGQLGKTSWYVSAKSGTNFSKPEYTYGGKTWDPGFDQAQY